MIEYCDQLTLRKKNTQIWCANYKALNASSLGYGVTLA